MNLAHILSCFRKSNSEQGAILPILVVVLLIGGLFVATRLTSIQQVFQSHASVGRAIDFSTKDGMKPLPYDQASGLPVTNQTTLYLKIVSPDAVREGTQKAISGPQRVAISDSYQDILNDTPTFDPAGYEMTNTFSFTPIHPITKDYNPYATFLPMGRDFPGASSQHPYNVVFNLTDPRPGVKTIFANFTYPDGHQELKQSSILYQPDSKECKLGAANKYFIPQNAGFVPDSEVCPLNSTKHYYYVCQDGTRGALEKKSCATLEQLSKEADSMCQGKSSCTDKSCKTGINTFTAKECGASVVCHGGYKVEIGSNKFTVGPEGGSFMPTCMTSDQAYAAAEKVCSTKSSCDISQTSPSVPVKAQEVHAAPWDLSNFCKADNQVSLTWQAADGATGYKIRVNNTTQGGWSGDCNNPNTAHDFCKDDISGTSFQFGVNRGDTYDIWLHGNTDKGETPASDHLTFSCNGQGF